MSERAVDSARVEDEGDAPIHELPADRRAVGVANIEIQDACRQIRVVRQTKRVVQVRRGKDYRSRALQALGKIQAD